VDNALDLWRIEYLSRYSGELSKKAQPFYYYIPVVFGLMVPFMLSLPEAAAGVFLKRYRSQRAGLAYALTWAVVGTAFLSTSSFKRPHNVLSMMPALCLLLGPVIDRLFFGVLAASRRAVRLTCAAVPIGLGVGLLIGAQVLQQRYPELIKVYVVTGFLLWVLWSLAAGLFAFGRRTKSLAVLLCWVAAIVVVAWPAMGRQMRGDPVANALVRAMEAQGIGRDAEIYWVEGRPDSSIEFYSGYQIRRLIDELEMAEIREDRSEVGADLLQEVGRRIADQLARPKRVYLIMSIGNFELMERETNIHARKVIELSGLKDQPGEELVVITQPTAASGPASGPASGTGP